MDHSRYLRKIYWVVVLEYTYRANLFIFLLGEFGPALYLNIPPSLGILCLCDLTNKKALDKYQ